MSLSPEEILATIEGKKNNQIELDKNKDSSDFPSKSQINSYYSHIKSLIIELFIIETRTQDKCGYCETWKENKLERKYFFQLHRLLGLEENSVHVSEVECDWNCLHATTYVDDEGNVRSYPTDIDIYGENYFYAYGMDIEYFPAIRVRLKSTKYKGAKTYFEAIFQGLGNKVNRRFKYKFNDQEYYREKKVPEVRILKPLLRFLRSLNSNSVDMPIHEKFSIYLGQYHRHVNN